MHTIKTITTPAGHDLVNVPAQLPVLLELGFSAEEAQILLQPPLAEVKAAKAAAIRAVRDKLTEDHITIDGNHYHSDPKSRIQQMGLAKLAGNNALPPDLFWMTKNNGLVAMTKAVALQFEPVTLAHDVALFAAAQAHIDAVEELDNAQDVLDYDFTGGWPS